MKLAIAQMVLGGLIALILFLGYLPFFAGGPPSLEWARVANYLVLILPFLGLAVLGCGIAQFLKAKG